jgi:hypothetical protein
MRPATMAVLIVPLIFSGCAGTSGLRVDGNETSVVIAPTGDVAQAFPLAEKHCANYGKVAHFNHMDGFRAVFDCETAGAR